MQLIFGVRLRKTHLLNINPTAPPTADQTHMLVMINSRDRLVALNASACVRVTSRTRLSRHPAFCHSSLRCWPERKSPAPSRSRLGRRHAAPVAERHPETMGSRPPRRNILARSGETPEAIRRTKFQRRLTRSASRRRRSTPSRVAAPGGVARPRSATEYLAKLYPRLRAFSKLVVAAAVHAQNVNEAGKRANGA